MTKAQKKTNFLEIKSAEMITKIISAATHHNIPVVLWLKGQSLKFESLIRSFSRKTGLIGVTMPTGLTDQQFNAAVREQGTDTIMGSLQVDEINFFFRTKVYTKLEHNDLKIELPSAIFKLQRRADMRIPLNRAAAPRLTFFDPLKEYSPVETIEDDDILAFRMLDVSVGGLSFAAKPEDVERFKIGVNLHDMRFVIQGTEIITEGVVRHLREVLNDQNKPILKVGVKFHGLRPSHGAILFGFVLEESRRIFTLLY